MEHPSELPEQQGIQFDSRVGRLIEEAREEGKYVFETKFKYEGARREPWTKEDQARMENMMDPDLVKEFKKAGITIMPSVTYLVDIGKIQPPFRSCATVDLPEEETHLVREVKMERPSELPTEQDIQFDSMADRLLLEYTEYQEKELRSRIPRIKLGVARSDPWTEEDTARMEGRIPEKEWTEQDQAVLDMMMAMPMPSAQRICETCGSTVPPTSYIRAPPYANPSEERLEDIRTLIGEEGMVEFERETRGLEHPMRVPPYANPSEEALEYARKLEEGRYELETLGLDEHPVFDPDDVNRLFEKPRIENSLRFIFTCVFTGGRTLLKSPLNTINIVSIGLPNNILLGVQQLNSALCDSDFKQPLIDHINRMQKARIVLCVEAGTGFFPQTVQDTIKKEFGSRVICMNDEGIIGLRATFESKLKMVHTTHMYLQLGHLSIWEGVTGALDKLKAELIEYKRVTKETTTGEVTSVYTGGDLAFTFQFCVYAMVCRFFVDPKYSMHHI